MSLSANSVYSDTLRSIIGAKLEELTKKRDGFESSKKKVLKAVRAESDKVVQLELLLTGIKHCFKIQKTGDGFSSSSTHNPDLFQLIGTLERFLRQPRFDPSISESMIVKWKTLLLRQFDIQSYRFEYASLYARLVTDWLSADKNVAELISDDNPTEQDVNMGDSFQKLDNSAKMTSRLEWEKSVFEPLDVSAENIKKLLEKLFGENDEDKKGVFKALTNLRQSVADFEEQLSKSGQFSAAVLVWCINGLLSSGTLTEEKRSVLRDFKSNTIILDELADVLNLRMANLEGWSWGNVVQVEQRRKVTGRYGIHMHEDLLQAIFIQYIGVKWAVFLRENLVKFIKTEDAWVPLQKDVPLADRKRRDYYLGRSPTKHSLQFRRTNQWLHHYFLTQLPTSEFETVTSRDGEQEAEYVTHDLQDRARHDRAREYIRRRASGRQLATKAARKSAPSPDYDDEIDCKEEDDDDDDMGFGLFGDEPVEPRIHNPMELKQRLLHLLRAEILINTHLKGQITAFRGRFEDWCSMLPHKTVMTVLQYLGLSPRWLQFIEAFLQAPLGFLEGGQVEPARTRLRGVPDSHPLSDFLGEVVLFCMDLLINQDCDGALLYRMHDDFWFWNSSQDLCMKAWSSVKKFSEIMGLTIDENKAGSAHVVQGDKYPANSVDLPSLPIRWGFLYLDSKSGQFEIDRKLVDDQIGNLKEQLKKKEQKGVFAWIQAWNVYADTFFATNFGKPSVGFGGMHVDRILSTLEEVQREVFDGSNVVAYLQDILKTRYEMRDIPEGYCYFPTQLGGLELRNPFVNLLQLHGPDKVGNPAEFLEKYDTSERDAYVAAKRLFDNGEMHRHNHKILHSDYFVEQGEKDVFFSFEEYTRHRESMSFGFHPNELSDVFDHLLEPLKEAPVDASSAIMTALNLMDKDGVVGSSSGINGNWYSMTNYWKWICQLYGPDIVEKFGGLNIVDNGVLPIGMVSLVKEDRVSWE